MEGGWQGGFMTLCALTSLSLYPPPLSELMGGFLMLFLAPPSWRDVRGRRREREERREVEEEELQGDKEERRRRRRRRGSHADFNCSNNTKVSAAGILLDRDREKNGSTMTGKGIAEA